mmetsp:Transcript_5583/g.16969  ORF Transcript_5583/g.16969 Transcript_5583/m.16969 type:complete len:84 (+) Transcript_5583:1041-1292(+)
MSTARYQVPPTQVVGAKPSAGLPSGMKLFKKNKSLHQYFEQSSECWSQLSFQIGEEDREGAIFQKKKRTAAKVGSSLPKRLTT